MPGIRIAMWSGPRTISTAMMRAWENRKDCEVWDEPLYPWWLAATGTEHPGRGHVLAAHDCDLDPASLASRLASADGDLMSYQKHMTHHLLPEFPREWMEGARHAFLIRRPDRVLASLAKRLPSATTQDTGLPQQVELLHWLDAHGHAPPPVIDSDDVLGAPSPMLESLCQSLGVPFDPAMLEWPAGGRDSDGAWADWWYDSVRASTGFGPPREEMVDVPPAQRDSLAECQQLYDLLAEDRIRV